MAKKMGFGRALNIAVKGAAVFALGAAGGYLAGTTTQTVDWGDTGSFLQGVAALLAAVVAAWGVNRWQQELRFKRNTELAEKVMVCAEALYDTLRQARETPQIFEQSFNNHDFVTLRAESYRNRLALLERKDYAAELRNHVHRVGVLFGSSYRDALEAALALNDDLRTSLRHAVWIAKGIENPDRYLHVNLDSLREMTPKLFQTTPSFQQGPDTSEFGLTINRTFQDLRTMFSELI